MDSHIKKNGGGNQERGRNVDKLWIGIRKFSRVK
jgi:hypothetical protein